MSGSRRQARPRHPLVRVAIWLTPLVLVGLLVAGGLLIFGSVGPTPLEKAADLCSVGENTVEARGNGTSLAVASGKNRTGWQATIMSVCVLTELGASDSVMEKIENSTEQTGPRSDSWDDYVVTWTYLPQEGLELVVETGEASGDFERALV